MSTFSNSLYNKLFAIGVYFSAHCCLCTPRFAYVTAGETKLYFFSPHTLCMPSTLNVDCTFTRGYVCLCPQEATLGNPRF